ncbi:hydroxyproline O-galactosyltransferase HPGT1 [Prunus yedoensis var. nudiflora]|uniref:Hydroxyproline O-galactosyltransferase HPGT1 n=1 Tax=Prunus yedoensis var. nudiflora TaxID=2094558 RepID=A0A314ZWB9_PRUYE|nr:hydroxyproline O-galactosyltransferase HPGT1 [Prunus yedoensis var. nudiflora]
MKYCSMLRNRMLADHSFLFKVGTAIVIDSCCATFAEVQKRGKDFWAEFELYVVDLLVGIAVDIALWRSIISADDTLKIIACREQHKKLSARQEGFTSMRSIEINGTNYKIRPLVVIGIFTTFGRKNNRDAIRKVWMGIGAALKKMENEKGIIAQGLFGMLKLKSH